MPSDYHRETALAALGDDESLLRELIEVFLADVPERLAALQAAASAGDLATVTHQAHALKGECGTLAATDTVAKFRALEMAARAGDAVAVGELLGVAVAAAVGLMAAIQ